MKLRSPTQGKCAFCLSGKEVEVATAISETGGFKPVLVCQQHAFLLAKNEPMTDSVEPAPNNHTSRNDA
jgi:hypothetical protein